MFTTTGPPITPLETPFAGRRFRSRLEARWAVFYSTIGVPWMYEPDAFKLADDLLYLPDFWLPQQQAFIEIKPDVPDAEAQRKAELLAQHTGKRVFIFFGLPGYQCNGGYPYGQLAADSAYCFFPDGGPDNYYTWCVCRTCGLFGIEFDGRSARLPCPHVPPAGEHPDKAYTNDDPRLLAGYDRANRARFAR